MPVKVTVPLPAAPTAVTVRVSPSTSVSLASTSNVVAPESSATVTVSGLATGASLTGVTMTVTRAVEVSPGVPVSVMV